LGSGTVLIPPSFTLTLEDLSKRNQPKDVEHKL
jgi:hypothetical protein